MRNRFDEQLLQLNNDLITMGAYCENAIAGAVKSLSEGDARLAERTIEAEREIDQKEKDIERLCLKLLLQQQPVARDLRLVSAALKMITDMERIGDQAADIAEIVLSCDLRSQVAQLQLSSMAYAVIKMVTDSINAFVNKDIQLAQAVIRYDDRVDDLFLAAKNDIIKLIRQNSELSEQAVDILMIAKYLERIGDHATNIAEWAAFSITGEHKE